MEKKLNLKIWKELVDKSKKIEVSLADLSKVDNMSFKQLRNDLQLTQSRFADILGVTKKTVEKWEQGANPIKGTARSLVYLIMDDHNIIDRLFKVKVTEPNELKISWAKNFNIKEVFITATNTDKTKENNYIPLNSECNLEIEKEKNQWRPTKQTVTHRLCS